MKTLFDVADIVRQARADAGLTQAELAQRAGVARTTVGKMENLTTGDMGVSIFVKLLDAAGYGLKVAKRGRTRTLEDIFEEERRDAAP